MEAVSVYVFLFCNNLYEEEDKKGMQFVIKTLIDVLCNLIDMNTPYSPLSLLDSGCFPWPHVGLNYMVPVFKSVKTNMVCRIQCKVATVCVNAIIFISAGPQHLFELLPLYISSRYFYSAIYTFILVPKHSVSDHSHMLVPVPGLIFQFHTICDFLSCTSCGDFDRP